MTDAGLSRARDGRGVRLFVLGIGEAMRPRQWIKNVFVFAALIFAARTSDAEAWARTVETFVAFCLLSGGSYLINDAFDVETDRQSTRTASRPIARGALSCQAALVSAAVAAVVGLALAAIVNWQTLLAATGFLALQLAYSIRLKRLLFIDVIAIAAGFVLRAVAGGLAISVKISPWLLLATGLLAVLLALTKRRAEAVGSASGGTTRSVVSQAASGVEHYSIPLLDELIAVVTPAILVVYCLYAAISAQSDLMLLTVPFVLYGIFRVLLLVQHKPLESDEPTNLVWEDRRLLACIVLWAITATVITFATR